MKLTQEQKRIKLAKAGGLKVIDIPFIPSQTKAAGCVFTDAAKTEWRKCYPNSFGIYGLPDYFEDINAVHELEEKLENCKIKWAAYRRNLWLLLEPHRHELNATAAQRAEALGLTLNLWTE